MLQSRAGSPLLVACPSLCGGPRLEELSGGNWMARNDTAAGNGCGPVGVGRSGSSGLASSLLVIYFLSPLRGRLGLCVCWNAGLLEAPGQPHLPPILPYLRHSLRHSILGVVGLRAKCPLVGLLPPSSSPLSTGS